MSITVFIPVRKGSERVQHKNTRRFADFENGLLEYKLNQLIGFEEADEIIVSSNDEKCIEISESFKKSIPDLKIDLRPEHLGDSNTDLTDLIKHVSEISNGDHILWTHVTSPFCQAQAYSAALKKYKKLSEYDSLMTGSFFQEFLWDLERFEILNNETQIQWPRTQDLKETFLVNSAIFIAGRDFYRKGNRIGNRPFLMEMEKLKSWDIDTEEDFKIAEMIYEEIFR